MNRRSRFCTRGGEGGGEAELCLGNSPQPVQSPTRLSGRSHRANLQAAELSSEQFRTLAPSWVSAADDPPQDVSTAWQPAELETFPMRATCLCPSVTVTDLPPGLKARFFRYLYDTFGPHYAEVVAVVHYMAERHSRYVRVKEVRFPL